MSGYRCFMTLRNLALTLCGAAAGILLVIGAQSALAEGAATPPPSCAQWELKLATSVSTTTLSAATVGAVEQAPAGWEPFAYAPSGQLSYRRCTK